MSEEAVEDAVEVEEAAATEAAAEEAPADEPEAEEDGKGIG